MLLVVVAMFVFVNLGGGNVVLWRSRVEYIAPCIRY